MSLITTNLTSKVNIFCLIQFFNSQVWKTEILLYSQRKLSKIFNSICNPKRMEGGNGESYDIIYFKEKDEWIISLSCSIPSIKIYKCN